MRGELPRENRDRCLVLLSRQDDALDVNRSAAVLAPFYEIIWDEQEGHKFKKIFLIYSACKPLKRWDKRGQQVMSAIGTG